jgi:hypothetical protein
LTNSNPKYFTNSGADFGYAGTLGVGSNTIASNWTISEYNATFVPEPVTILGTGVALGLGTLFKKKKSSIQLSQK